MRRTSAASAAEQWKSKWSRDGGVKATAWQVTRCCASNRNCRIAADADMVRTRSALRLQLCMRRCPGRQRKRNAGRLMRDQSQRNTRLLRQTAASATRECARKARCDRVTRHHMADCSAMTRSTSSDRLSPTPSFLDEDRRRLLQHFLQRLHDLGRVVAVDEAVIERRRQVHHQAHGDRAVQHRPAARPPC